VDEEKICYILYVIMQHIEKCGIISVDIFYIV